MYTFVIVISSLELMGVKITDVTVTVTDVIYIVPPTRSRDVREAFLVKTEVRLRPRR